jgi:hypothetical protein
MKQNDIYDTVLVAAQTPATFRRWIARPSVEAVEIRKRLEGIVGLFHDLDAALDGLGYRGDRAVCQLSHQVRAQMIDGWLLDVADYPPARFDDNGHFKSLTRSRRHHPTISATLPVRLNRLLSWKRRARALHSANQ